MLWLDASRGVEMYLNDTTNNCKKIWKYTKAVIRSRKSKKVRQHNGQKKDRRTNNDLQNIT
jgi:hypothetical protein